MNPPLGLLKFCIEHSDGTTDPNLPQRNSEDYKWLKEALDNLQTDAQRMKKLIEIIKSTDTSETAIFASLEELQFYVEDIDNGNDLWRINGVEPLLEILKSDEKGNDIKMNVLWVLATVVQNNEESQIKAMNAGILELVLTIAKKEIAKPSKELNTGVLSKAMSVISALVKGSNEGLNRFMDQSGFELLTRYLQCKELNEQTQVKAVFMLKYLLDHKGDVSRANVRSYGLVERLLDLAKANTSDQGLDVREKVLMALNQFLKKGDKEEKLVNLEECRKYGVVEYLNDRVGQIQERVEKDEALKDRFSDELSYSQELLDRFNSLPK